MSSCNQTVNLCNPNEKFWMDDIRELYQNNNYLKFVPKYEMTRTEQLNAITRLCLYFIILILLFDQSEEWLYLPITIIVLVVILYNINKMDKHNQAKQNKKIMNIRQQEQIEAEQMEKFDLPYDGKTNVKTDIDEQYYNRPNPNLQTGQYDSNGVLNVGPKVGPNVCKNGNNLLTLDEMINYQKNTCRVPTYDNPAMNLSMMDYNNAITTVACNADDEEIKDDMIVKFNHDLFRDVDELWERENNRRAFYTTPNFSIPNHQTEFSKWLWAKPDSFICKFNPSGGACQQYVNLRDRRDPIPQ
jgi:hypothetical protein